MPRDDEPVPYLGGWDIAAARRFFARPAVELSLSIQAEQDTDGLRWREVTFAAEIGAEAVGTVVSPLSAAVTQGVVLAHGGTDDGRRFFVAEAAALAARGAVVVLPVTRFRLDDGADAFADDVRTAVLTERAALDVLVEHDAPPAALSFLGHSAGGTLGALLTAVEPRLARVVAFATGAGPLATAVLAGDLSRVGNIATARAVADWLDPARFVAVERSAELLVQHGRADSTVPIEAATALFDAAAAPKRWVEYDWDHGLDADPRARRDRADFVFGSQVR